MVKLVDASARNKKYPKTFQVPSKKEVKALCLHSLVKLGVITTPPSGVERMWFRIVEIKGDQFKGRLQNTPLNGDMRYGDEIYFNGRHIMSI